MQSEDLTLFLLRGRHTWKSCANTVLWALPLWPDIVSTVHFCSNAASPATAPLGNSLKHDVSPIPDPSNNTWLQACFCDRPHVLHQLLQQLQTDARGKIRIESLRKKAVETPYLEHTWIDSLALAKEQ